MENGLDMIEQGRVGLVTLLGMGGVFIALLCLFLFTTVLNKTGKRGRPRRKPALQEPPPGPAEASAEPGGTPSGKELAAAVAVAWSIQMERKPRTLVLQPTSRNREENPWKMAGRLALMKPFGSRGLDAHR